MKIQIDDDVVIRFTNDIQVDVCTHLDEVEAPVFEQRVFLAGTEIEVFVLDFVERLREPKQNFYQLELPNGGIISIPDESFDVV